MMENDGTSLVFDKPGVLRLLAYRMQAVEILNWALRLASNQTESAAVAVFIDGKLSIEGKLAFITNPMLEAGIIHCRALMEFLGLGVENEQLIERKKRIDSDIGIEHFSNAGGPLPKVAPSAALEKYQGQTDEARKALLMILRTTNKKLAHNTKDFFEDPEDRNLIEIASRGIPSLMISYFYTPLGIHPPCSVISARPRE